MMLPSLLEALCFSLLVLTTVAFLVAGSFAFLLIFSNPHGVLYVYIARRR